MAGELLIMLLCLLSLWIACLEINVALYILYATALHSRRNTVCSALLSNGPRQTLRRYRVRAQLYGLGHPREPSPRATLAEVTFSLFLSKLQPTVYIKIANSSRGARQLGWASCLSPPPPPRLRRVGDPNVNGWLNFRKKQAKCYLGQGSSGEGLSRVPSGGLDTWS